MTFEIGTFILFLVLVFFISTAFRSEYFSNHNKYILSLGLLIVGFLMISGINLIASKIPTYYGLILLFLSFYYNQLFYAHDPSSEYGKDYKLLVPFLYSKKFRIIGLLLFIFIVIWELFYSDKYIGDYTFLSLFFSFFLISYHLIPEPFYRLREFMLIFQFLLIIILLLPSFLSLIAYNLDFEFDDDKIFEFTLTKPLGKILTLLGYEIYAEGNELRYINLESNSHASVLITSGCSGIYSVFLFLAAFITYSITELRQVNFFILLLLIQGLMIAYISNLFRMVVIVMVGIHFTPEALFWVHSNLGWLFFAIWLSIFWYIMSNYIFKRDLNRRSSL